MLNCLNLPYSGVIQSPCTLVVPIVAFEELEYTFSETDGVANVCVVTVNGAVDREVSFTVRTALGNASGTLVEPYMHKNNYVISCVFLSQEGLLKRFCCRLALFQSSCMYVQLFHRHTGLHSFHI